MFFVSDSIDVVNLELPVNLNLYKGPNLNTVFGHYNLNTALLKKKYDAAVFNIKSFENILVKTEVHIYSENFFEVKVVGVSKVFCLKIVHYLKKEELKDNNILLDKADFVLVKKLINFLDNSLKQQIINVNIKKDIEIYKQLIGTYNSFNEEDFFVEEDL